MPKETVAAIMILYRMKHQSESMFSGWRHRLLQHCNRCTERGHTTPIPLYHLLSKFLRQSLLIFIIKVFRTIVFIFIVISTTFRPICPPAFFRCLSNSGTFMALWTTSFIETTGVACSDSVCRVQVLSIPVYYSPIATFRWLSS